MADSNLIRIQIQADASAAVASVGALEKEFIDIAEIMKKINEGELDIIPADLPARMIALSKGIGNTEIQLRKAKAEGYQLGDAMRESVLKSLAALGNLKGGIRAIGFATGDAQKKMGGLGKEMIRLGSIARTVIASVVVRAFIRWTAEAVNLSREMEKLILQFNAFSSTAAEAAEDLDLVKKTAQDLGVDFRSLTQGFLRLKAAAKGTSLEGESLKNVFQSVATTVRAVGSQTDEVKGIFFAFEQLISKNIVSAEELRRQLGDRIPGAFKRMADAIGVTTEQLDGMLERGELLAEVALPLFAAELEKTFGQAAIAQAATLDAEFSRMQNTVSELAGEFADGLTPAMTDAMQTMRAGWRSSLTDMASATGDTLGIIGQTFSSFFASIGQAFDGQAEAAGALLLRFFAGVNLLVIRSITNIRKSVRNTLGGMNDDVAAVVRSIPFVGAFIAAAVDTTADAAEKRINEWAELSVETFAQHAEDASDSFSRVGTSQEEMLAEMEARIEQLSGAGIENLDSLDGVINELSASIESFSGLAKQAGDSTKAMWKEGHSGFRVLKKQLIGIILEAEELGDKVGPELRKRLDELGKQFGVTSEDIARAEKSFDTLSIKAVESIEEMSSELGIYVMRVGQAGDATAAQSDVIVKGAQAALTAIQALPDRQRALFKDIEAQLEGYVKAYEGYTTKAIEAEQKKTERIQKELEQQQKAAEDAAEKMGEAFEKAFSKLSSEITKETDKAKAKIKELEALVEGFSGAIEPGETDVSGFKDMQAELEKLREKASLTSEEVERIVEIEDKLSEARFSLKDELKDARNEAEGLVASGKLVNDMITGLISKNKALQEGYRLLNKEERSALESAISDFQGLGNSVGVSQQDIEQFAKDVGGILGRIGVDPVDLLGDLGLQQDGILDVAGAFDQLDKSVSNFEEKKRREKKLLDENALSLIKNKEGADAYRSSLEKLSTETGKVDGPSGEDSTITNQSLAADKTPDFAPGELSLTTTSDTSGLENLNDETEKFLQLSDENRRALGLVGDSVDGLSDSYQDWVGTGESAMNNMDRQNEALLVTNEGLETYYKNSSQTLEGVENLGEGVEEAEGVFRNFTEATWESLQADKKYRDSLGESALVVDNLRIHNENLGKAMVRATGEIGEMEGEMTNLDAAAIIAERSMSDINIAMADTVNYSSEAQESLDEVSENLKSDLPSGADKTERALSELNVSMSQTAKVAKETFDGLPDKVKELNDELRVTADLFKEISESVLLVKEDGQAAATILLKVFRDINEII